ncbi:MAG TPA: nucleotidyltransferase family protein [Actinospica sp.]|nr:nucleotidyltransferase family protein [Actinospica sp.]
MANQSTQSGPVTQAIVLAGGKGSRLRPYTDTRPKTLIEIPGTGRTILEHQLDWLAEEGVTDVVLSCGHLAEVLEQWIADTELPVRVTTAVEKTELGRGGGLKFAARGLPRPDEHWYALNADIWTRFPLREMAAVHAGAGVLGTLALARPRIPWGVIELDESAPVEGGGLIADFVESPLTPWPVNAGVYVFAPEFTPLLPDLGDHERTTFPALAHDRKLAGYLIPEGVYWRAIDTAKDLETAAKELAALRRP